MTDTQPATRRMTELAGWVKHLLFLLGLGAVGYLGESGKDGGFIKDIWQALKTASPPVAMVLFVLFLDERRERREAQKQCNERTVDFILSTNLHTATGEKASKTLSEMAEVLRTVVLTLGMKLGRRKKRGAT